jgi:hypothetical protein
VRHIHITIKIQMISVSQNVTQIVEFGQIPLEQPKQRILKGVLFGVH